MATLEVVPVAATAPPVAAIPAATAVTLYAVEDYLAAMTESLDTVEPADEAQFLVDFEAALTRAVEKRDRVGQFLAHLEGQIVLAKSEIERLRERKATYERVLERVGEYVIRTIKNLGPDAKGKYRKLEGNTVTFSLRGCAPSVEITDEMAVPADYKTVTVKLPALTWEGLLDSLDLEVRSGVLAEATKADIAVSKTAVKAAMECGVPVPGADLLINRHSLVRR